MNRAWFEVAAVLAAGFVPGLPTPLVGMLVVASVLRWVAGSSWGEAGLGGGAAFRDVSLGLAAGVFAFVVVSLVAGTQAIGELAIVRGNSEMLVVVLIVTAALAAASEMVFRGFVMTRIARATDSWALGNILSALAFGIAIGGDDIGAVVGIFVAGCGYGVLYLASDKRLALPIAAHVGFATTGVMAAFLKL